MSVTQSQHPKTAQKKKQAAPVKKPYLTGAPFDGNSLKSALILLGMLALTAFVYLIAATALMIDIAPLRIALNVVLLVLTWQLFSASGRANGAVAVNQGEIMYRRQERGETVTAKDRSLCFHPAKGFLIGLIGSLPLFLVALGLALTATRQMTTAGALPSWLGTLAEDPDFATAVSAYTTQQHMTVTDVLRIITRVELLPWVNLIGSENADLLLLFERLSPLLVLLPGLSYGWGYTRGVQERTRVHTDIAAANKRREKRNARAKKARAASTPKQLN